MDEKNPETWDPNQAPEKREPNQPPEKRAPGKDEDPSEKPTTLGGR